MVEESIPYTKSYPGSFLATPPETGREGLVGQAFPPVIVTAFSPLSYSYGKGVGGKGFLLEMPIKHIIRALPV